MHIGIVGLGLIGGSLGLDLQSQGHYVWGVSRRQATCEQAVALGAVTAAYERVAEVPVLDQTAVIFLCTPIGDIIPTLKALVPLLSPATIVTDVGSVKTAIVKEGMHLWPRFVGGHPMAGTAASGICAAQRNLFHDRPCALITKPDHPDGEVVAALWRSVGMAVHYCGAEVHDQAVAWISHLPVMVSGALLLACGAEPQESIALLGQILASSGFRDTSRVGGGNPELGQWMARANREALLKTLTIYQGALENLKQRIVAQEWDVLADLLTKAHCLRQKYPGCQNGQSK